VMVPTAQTPEQSRVGSALRSVFAASVAALARFALSARKRVDERDAGEAPEVVVGGRNLATVFDCEGRQMCIRRQVAGRSRCDEKIPENGPMAVARTDEHGIRLRQPIVDEADGLLDRKGPAHDAGAW
jgi:hypothetical protein